MDGTKVGSNVGWLVGRLRRLRRWRTFDLRGGQGGAQPSRQGPRFNSITEDVDRTAWANRLCVHFATCVWASKKQSRRPRIQAMGTRQTLLPCLYLSSRTSRLTSRNSRARYRHVVMVPAVAADSPCPDKYGAGPGQPATAARGHGQQQPRKCSFCNKPITLIGPMRPGDNLTCQQCRQVAQTGQAASMHMQAPTLKHQPLRGLSTAGPSFNRLANPRPMQQSSFYGSGDGGNTGGRGLDLRAPIVNIERLTWWTAAMTTVVLTRMLPSASRPVARQAPKNKFDKLSAQVAGLKCCFPKEGGKHSVQVFAEDLARLDSGEFLNDTCIDFYLKYIEAHLQTEIRRRYHFFNSFFLKKLQEKPAKGVKLSKAERLKLDHERVKKWTKHVDLFSKDFIFVPIHGTLHWSLVLICHPGNVVQQADHLRPPEGGPEGSRDEGGGAGTPLLLHLDSLDGNHAPKAIFEALRSYLEHEWRRNMEDETQDSVPRRWKARFLAAGRDVPEVRFTLQTLPGLSMAARLPKQDNHTDCGLFLLSYVDFFVAANPRCIVSEGSNAQNVHALDPRSDAANAATLLQKNWFHKCNAARLRDHLRALVCKLMLECVPAEDQRFKTLECVVNSYAEKPHEMGQRYLQPEEYLKYVTMRPNEPWPILDDGVLSNESDHEGHMEDPVVVLQNPTRHMTRLAAKQAGVAPAAALPTSGNRRRKGSAASEAAPAPPSQPPGPATNPESVVDLSTPDKVGDVPRATAAVMAGPTEQAPAGGSTAAAAGPQAGEAPPIARAKAESMEIEDEEHEDDEGVELVAVSHGPASGGEARSDDQPAAKRPRLLAEAVPETLAQVPATTGRGAAAKVEVEVEDLGASSSDEDKDSPPRRPRSRWSTGRGCKQGDLHGAPPSGSVDDVGADGQKVAGQDVPPSQEDPEALPKHGAAAAAIAAQPVAAAPPGGVRGELPCPDSGAPDEGGGASGGSRTKKFCRKVKRGPEAPGGTAPPPGGYRRGLQTEDTGVASHAQVEQPPINGLVLGDSEDIGEDDINQDPAWLLEHQARFNLSAGGGGGGGGGSGGHESSSGSEDERGALQSVADRGREPGGRVKPHPPDPQQKPQRAGCGPVADAAGAAGPPARGQGATLGGPCRKHTRFPDDGAEPITKMVPIRPEEAPPPSPPPSPPPPRPHTGAAQQPQPQPQLEAYSIEDSDSDNNPDRAKRRRCGEEDAAMSAYPPAMESSAHWQVSVVGVGDSQAAIDAAVDGALQGTPQGRCTLPVTHQQQQEQPMSNGQLSEQVVASNRDVPTPGIATQAHQPIAEHIAPGPAVATPFTACRKPALMVSRFAQKHLSRPRAAHAAAAAAAVTIAGAAAITGAGAAATATRAAASADVKGAAAATATTHTHTHAHTARQPLEVVAASASAARPLDVSGAREHVDAKAISRRDVDDDDDEEEEVEEVEDGPYADDLSANLDYPPTRGAHASTSMRWSAQESPPLSSKRLTAHGTQVPDLSRPANGSQAHGAQGSHQQQPPPPPPPPQQQPHDHVYQRQHQHHTGDPHVPQTHQAGPVGSLARMIHALPALMGEEGVGSGSQGFSHGGDVGTTSHGAASSALPQPSGSAVSHQRESFVDTQLCGWNPQSLPPFLPPQLQQQWQQQRVLPMGLLKPVYPNTRTARTAVADLPAAASHRHKDLNGGVRNQASEAPSWAGDESQGRTTDGHAVSVHRPASFGGGAEQHLQGWADTPRPPQAAKAGVNRIRQEADKVKKRWRTSELGRGTQPLPGGVPWHLPGPELETVAVTKGPLPTATQPAPAALYAGTSCTCQPQEAGPSRGDPHTCVAAGPSPTGGDRKRRRRSELDSLDSQQQLPPERGDAGAGPGQPHAEGCPHNQPKWQSQTELQQQGGGERASVASYATATAATTSPKGSQPQPQPQPEQLGEESPTLSPQLVLVLDCGEGSQEQQQLQQDQAFRLVEYGGSLTADDAAGASQSLGGEALSPGGIPGTPSDILTERDGTGTASPAQQTQMQTQTQTQAAASTRGALHATGPLVAEDAFRSLRWREVANACTMLAVSEAAAIGRVLFPRPDSAVQTPGAPTGPTAGPTAGAAAAAAQGQGPTTASAVGPGGPSSSCRPAAGAMQCVSRLDLTEKGAFERGDPPAAAGRQGAQGAGAAQGLIRAEVGAAEAAWQAAAREVAGRPFADVAAAAAATCGSIGRGRAVEAMPSDSLLFSPGSGGEASGLTISIGDDMEENQAAREEPCKDEQVSGGGDGGGQPHLRAQAQGEGGSSGQGVADGGRPAGRGTENESAGLEGSPEEEDSVDIVEEWRPGDATEEDSSDAFVDGRGTGSGRVGSVSAMKHKGPGRGKQAAGRQPTEGSRRRRSESATGRSKSRKAGQAGGSSKPSSSTKGVTLSRGGAAAASRGGGKPQNQRGSLAIDALTGPMDAYYGRAEHARRNPKSTDAGPPGTGQSRDEPCDLTSE
ncbi:hypothetical protein VOLCADRAFT_86350 [Volvox carteri f. nagariensis]|uniref:Ubiquitin-like protease family profile domain-containing protein n=1 Tax=Volvox carteri f. nagariensis TaxID=3068 RepID=D8TIJ3_VOLCA|nr:uncharacterized protein VOLCADRAFT_86350 [Volvox carteri f. nagariensis]EFJ53251.1 hypothetical protein VOLCADRAFT_86350 [Volvox carteri f. nagariensis]|eukprot:XP_002946256.1 hypothetical protein VOLCADRAFT_86350 [Volvox carteri f. nagariensis]